MEYAFKDYNKEHMARAYGTSLRISTKHAVEIASMIRGKSLQRAKSILLAVIEKRQAVPFKKRKRDIAHKTGMSSGRYPVKAASEILKLLESAEKNAQFAGLDTASLKVRSIIAKKAAIIHKYGRKRGRTGKNTHVEITLEETKREKKSKEGSK
ncbi:MAG: 50S ribosomal protein L22 [Candidatus Woesearchaeota archaeon]